jgi:hypothetical protein
MVPTRDGELVEIAVGETSDVRDREVFYAELRGYALERGYKLGWAAHKFCERYGVMPPWRWNKDPALPPSRGTRGWILSRYIAWRKSGRGRAA